MCLTEWIELAIAQRERLTGSGKRGEGVDINAAREVLAVAKEDRRSESRVIVVIVIGLGEPVKRFGIITVEDLWPVHADLDDLSTPLDRDFGVGRQGDIGHRAFNVDFHRGLPVAPPPAQSPPGSACPSIANVYQIVPDGDV